MSTEIALRASIRQLEGYRKMAITQFAEATAAMNTALKTAALAAGGKGIYVDDDFAKCFFGRGYAKHDFATTARMQLDRQIWDHLIEAHGLERIMDKKARDEFREQLRNDPPEATAENAYATISTFLGQADLIFKRGIANAFSQLDRRFRTHDGFKIGSKIILSNAFTDYGSWNYHRRQDETLRDVERAFYILDGKPVPDRVGNPKPDNGGPAIAKSFLTTVDEARPRGFGMVAFQAEDDMFRLRAFKNGNAHLFFKRDDLVTKVNKQLADYYGDVLPAGSDCAEVKPQFNRTPAKNYGFFPTPEAVVSHLIERANIYPKPLKILEPEAGTGRIASAVADENDVTCVEIQRHMADELAASGKYRRVIHNDFFDVTPEYLGLFDRIIMNPPFDGQRDIDHVTHAVSFLEDEGRLVAVMAAGVEFRENAKAVKFRQLVEARKGAFFDLPPASFAESGTMVNTVICVIPGIKAGPARW